MTITIDVELLFTAGALLVGHAAWMTKMAMGQSRQGSDIREQGDDIREIKKALVVRVAKVEQKVENHERRIGALEPAKA